MIVSSRILTCFKGDSCKPSFATITGTGKGDNPTCICPCNPNDPCFGWKRSCFGELKFKNRGHLGSKSIYNTYIYISHYHTPFDGQPSASVLQGQIRQHPSGPQTEFVNVQCRLVVCWYSDAMFRHVLGSRKSSKCPLNGCLGPISYIHSMCLAGL